MTFAVPGQPKYLRIAADLREKIRAGEYRVGDRLPSLDELAATYGVAVNTIRDALKRLQSEGVTESFQGAGTEVRAIPAEGAQDRHAALVARVGKLAEEVRRLRENSPGSDGIWAALERLEANLIDLYGKLGYEYPHEGAPEDGSRPSKAVGT